MKDWKKELAIMYSKFSRDISSDDYKLIETLLEEARKEMKEEILKKIPEMKVPEIKLPQDDLRVLRARQYHNQKLAELSDFISSL